MSSTKVICILGFLLLAISFCYHEIVSASAWDMIFFSCSVVCSLPNPSLLEADLQVAYPGSDSQLSFRNLV